MDRYFTSISLLDELHLIGMHGTGTLQPSKVPHIAPLFTDGEMSKGGRGFINQVVRDDSQI